MSFTFGSQLFGAILFFSFMSQVIGHSYVTSPITRSNQAERLTGCRGPNCLGPCDAPLSSIRRSPITAMRGDAITVKWPRNNHAGGFIRFAWASTSQSDSHAAFDAHVQQINCHEVGGCHPDDISNPNGGDSGPADGSSRACTSNITVPLDLTDGQWTLQWSWFGGAFALGDYYSCVDYKIGGGPVGSLTPVFVGGDFANPGSDKCKFFNTDKLHVCVDEPCQNAIYATSVQQSGSPAQGQLGLIINTEIETSSSTSSEMESSSSTSSDVVDSSSSSTSGDVVVDSSSSSTSGDVVVVVDSSSSSSGNADESMSTSSQASEDSTSSEDTLSSSSSGSSLSSSSGDQLSSSGDASTPTSPAEDSSSTSTGSAVQDSSSTSSTSSNDAAPEVESSTSSTGSNDVVPEAESSSTSSSSNAAPSTPSVESSTTSTYGCVLGSMVCAGEGQYQTCTNGRYGNYWSNIQNCHPGLACHPSGSFIYCY